MEDQREGGREREIKALFLDHCYPVEFSMNEYISSVLSGMVATRLLVI